MGNPATDGNSDSLSTYRPIQPASEREGLMVESPDETVAQDEKPAYSIKDADMLLRPALPFNRGSAGPAIRRTEIFHYVVAIERG